MTTFDDPSVIDAELHLLDHVLDCEVCLSVVTNLSVSTKLCETKCPEYRALMRGVPEVPDSTENLL